MTRDKVEEIIKQIDFFPDRPGPAYQVMGRLDDPATTLEDLVEIMEYDIGLTTNVLKFSNSSLFQYSRTVGSVREAARRLGLEELKKLIAMSASTDIFAKGHGHPGYEISKGEMRRHSIASAVISRQLLPYAPDMTADLFTTCLLHDVGKMVLSEYVGHQYEEITRLTNERRFDFAEAEEKTIGMTHAEVGARILEKWDFPDQMVTAVRHHHNPLAAPDSTLTHFVSLADTIAMILGFTTGVDALDYKGFPGLYKKYKLKEKNIEQILMNSIDDIQEVIRFERRTKSREEENKK